MKSDLSGLYKKAGLKSLGIVFLMTDAQVTEERFLVLVNDMLASGEIPELFPDDEVENIVNALRNEVKSFGLMDTKENCWRFFIDRVRHQLKIVLCFSPVGSTLRIRSRKFPAITNCTAIDWFHEWPQEALESVSARFLEEIEDLPEKLQRSVSLFMAYVHTSVNTMSQTYLENERRYNYTTPKTFLEQINLYGKLLSEKTKDLKGRIVRLVNGLEKLRTTAAQVDDLKVILAEQEIELNEKNLEADKLIQVVGVETEKVSKEKAFAAEEEKKVRVIEEDVSIKQKVCAEDLRKAEPALIAAQEALNTLNKTNLTELKSFGSPPAAVVNVTAAVLVLFAPKGRIPKDRSWKACKMMMGKVDSFLDNLIHYAKEEIQPEVYKAVQQYIEDPEFRPEKVVSKSFAAAGLCAWVINIIKFYDVYVVVEPKRKALNQANIELAAARERLKFLNTQIASLEEQLAVLTADFQAATGAKLKCQAEADATANTIDLANRLVNGLASENIRWRQSVQDYKDRLITLPGDILMVTAFISYVGCFIRAYRIDLQKKYWEPFIKTLVPAIPMTPEIDPMDLLTDDAQIAQWNNEGLPNDRMSSENATVLTNSERWPLMIDPQLQGIKWIKNKYGSELKVIRLTHKNYLDIIENALSEGLTVLLENIGETVDAVLDPLLGRNLIKKGRAIKIGDKEMDFNSRFRLILQTKLANPHYKPEMQAQTTLINFTVTRDGLEEQLLAEVVKAERPDLEELRSQLTKQQNDFKITLKGLLESSIKITNEPPSGMMANLHKALDNFNQETLEMCSKEAEFKAILFVLCYFHAVVNERRKFGAQGWNRSYPFNVGDLTISVNVLFNYLENCTKIPWEDLRYLFGEIMYGGHITDDWDRRLCRTFLQEWLKDELMDGDILLAPGFPAPGNMDYMGYRAYIDDNLPSETPYLYGLHPNAEIGFLTTSSETLFRTVFEMQPRDAGTGASITVTREEKVKSVLDEIMDKVPEPFNVAEIMAKVEERTPYIIVAFQECERMNFLMGELRRSLRELDLGLKGELTITQEMESLEECLFMDQVPPSWTAKAYPSMLTLGPWFADLLLRLKELESWSSDFNLPATVWLAGFFNPQSFLTAIMQSTARKNEWPLDKMCLHCDVSKKQKDEITSAPREGAYVHGLFMEGARWDIKMGSIVESRLKELFPHMPVIFIKAITQDKQDLRNMYECPVYKTRIRGPTFVWTFNLKTKEKAAKWTMAGVAILLQV